MIRELNDDEKQKLEDQLQLYDMNALEHRLHELGGPYEAAVQLGYHSRLPHTLVVLQHVMTAAQIARYHLYLAHYERAKYQISGDPYYAHTDDFVAFFLFTSYALHATATANHLIVALAQQFDYNYNREGNTVRDDRLWPVYKRLKKEGQDDYASILSPFLKDGNEDWIWLDTYRDRWTHRNPMRIAELGVQYDINAEFWTDHDTSWRMTLNTRGDKPEITVADMLSKGVSTFDVLGQQINKYIALLESGAMR